jgi:hypothetical protein
MTTEEEQFRREAEKTIRGLRACIAVSSFVCGLCLGAAVLYHTLVPIGGVLSNAIATLVGCFAIRHVRRQRL